MGSKSFHVPNYYRDKEGRQYATTYLENLSYGSLRALIIDNNIPECTKLLAKICDINFKPKFFDDTVFVVVSRLHPAITAARIISRYHFDKLSVPQQFILNRFIDFVKGVYIPYSKKLHTNIFHRFSNHGAIGIMGEAIAHQFLLDFNGPSTEKRLFKLKQKLNKHLKCVVKKNGELWPEVLRTKKGLYYTYLHLAAILRAKLVLESLFYNNDFSKADEKFAEALTSYIQYYGNPETWPHMEMTKIPILRQLQKLIFPSDEFLKPRPDGKEGAFIDFINKVVVVGINIPFAPTDTYFEVEGPIPFSSFFAEHMDFLV